MRRRVYHFVRGILGHPGDAKEWNEKAVPWIFNNSHDWAENFETKVGPLDRLLGQWQRARNFARTLNEFERYEEVNHVIVAHSNGCDVALKGLALAKWPRVEALHLVSAACEADFWRNGLNAALSARLIGRVCLYRAGLDRALPLAKFFWPFCVRNGWLGLDGPLNVSGPVKDRVGEIVRPEFGHSTWFSKKNFDRSMQHFTHQVRHGDNWGITPAGNEVRQ